MNIITVILYERLHRYIYDEHFNLKDRLSTLKKPYLYERYKRYSNGLKGWRIVLSIWLPFIKKYRRYSYYNSTLSKYELSQVNKLSKLVYKLKLKLIL
jgi:hypothetical protein